MPEIERPSFIESDEELREYLDYLDNLRESGVTNMFGASPYLVETYELSTHNAKEVLKYWMKTF